MPAITAFGGQTKTTFLHTEAHKTTQEFVAFAAIKRGQQIKLDNVGRATQWTPPDGRNRLIGVAYNDALANENVTVWTRGYAIIWALSSAAIVCNDPVTTVAYDSITVVNGTSGYVTFANVPGASPDQAIGWALDDATGALELIRILLMD